MSLKKLSKNFVCVFLTISPNLSWGYKFIHVEENKRKITLGKEWNIVLFLFSQKKSLLTLLFNLSVQCLWEVYSHCLSISVWFRVVEGLGKPLFVLQNWDYFYLFGFDPCSLDAKNEVLRLERVVRWLSNESWLLKA